VSLQHDSFLAAYVSHQASHKKDQKYAADGHQKEEKHRIHHNIPIVYAISPMRDGRGRSEKAMLYKVA
jgi:hypothetical protein